MTWHTEASGTIVLLKALTFHVLNKCWVIEFLHEQTIFSHESNSHERLLSLYFSPFTRLTSSTPAVKFQNKYINQINYVRQQQIQLTHHEQDVVFMAWQPSPGSGEGEDMLLEGPRSLTWEEWNQPLCRFLPRAWRGKEPARVNQSTAGFMWILDWWIDFM